MPDHLERISISDRLNRPMESEGARLTWVEDACELVISYSNLQAKELYCLDCC